MKITISDSVKYIGVDDTTLDLFESQYVIPEGISYNSYVIIDKKIAVMDTVDKRKMADWEENLFEALNGRQADYLVIQHMEPDHSGAIARLLELFPDITLVGNQKTFLFLSQFFELDSSVKTLVVKEGDTLCLGKHTLTFYMATMVHWPEVMVTYDNQDKILFTADGFGKFGSLELTKEEDWECEARRYYFNICGKYGVAVQALIKKIKNMNVVCICPLHGPILHENLEKYIELYDIWSSYQPETEGVLIAYASIHGNTAFVAQKLGEILKEKGVKEIVVRDLARSDMAEVLEEAFRYDRMILAAASYDAGVFPCMQDFLHHLQSKAYQKRKVAIVENGTWSPSAGRTMRGILDTMKDLKIVEPMVTIRSTLKQENMDDLIKLADAML